MTSSSAPTPNQIKKIRKKFILPAGFTSFSVLLFGLGLIGAISEPFRHQEFAIEVCLILSAVLAMNAVLAFGGVIAEMILVQRP